MGTKCHQCHRTLDPDQFPLKVRGNPTGDIRTKICVDCTSKRQYQDNAKREESSHQAIAKLGQESTLPTESLDSFLQLLSGRNGNLDLEVRIDITSLLLGVEPISESQDLDDKHRAYANYLVTRIGEIMKYRFTYVTALSKIMYH